MNNTIDDDDETIIDSGFTAPTLNTQNVNDFEIVEKSEGKSKSNNGTVVVETAIKGLSYRVEAFLNGNLLDAKEVDCKDLTLVASSEESFQNRYLDEHKQMCNKYFTPIIWENLLIDKGEYKEGGNCVVTTYMGATSYKTIVTIDGVELEVIEVPIEDNLKNNENILKLKYTRSHKDLVEKNFLVKKPPFYKTSSMKVFYLFIVIVAFIILIGSFLTSEKDMNKIVENTFGIETTVSKKVYDITPNKLKISLAPESLYLANNSSSDLIFKLKDRIIDNLDDPTITGDMIISVIGKTELMIKPNQDNKKFEFKLEDTFINSNALKSGHYTGKLIFEVTGLSAKKDKLLEIPLEFDID